MKKTEIFYRITHILLECRFHQNLQISFLSVENGCGGNYGCRSGYGTPPHITLLAPFTLPDRFSDNDVFVVAQKTIEECKNQKIFPFDVKVSGFGSFSDRTLFINVNDSDE